MSASSLRMSRKHIAHCWYLYLQTAGCQMNSSTVLLTFTNKLHSSLSAPPLSVVGKSTCTDLTKGKNNLGSYDRTVTSPASHITSVSVCLCAVIDSWAPLSLLDVTVWLTMQQGKPGPYIPIGQQMGVKEGLASCYSPLTQSTVCKFLYLYSCLCIYYIQDVVFKT